jgi:hypothetical protein
MSGNAAVLLQEYMNNPPADPVCAQKNYFWGGTTKREHNNQLISLTDQFSVTTELEAENEPFTSTTRLELSITLDIEI